jgi:hypothetical protein
MIYFAGDWMIINNFVRCLFVIFSKCICYLSILYYQCYRNYHMIFNPLLSAILDAVCKFFHLLSLLYLYPVYQ